MNWFAALLFAGVALMLLLGRRSAAHWQGLILGSRMPPGCAVIEALILILLAILIIVFRPYDW